MNGYNCSILAYGQTGSGKSFTMFGLEADPVFEGLVPRICKALIKAKKSSITYNNSPTKESNCTTSCIDSYVIKVSYVEIYLERVKDLLLDESNNENKLRVRENPITGTYIEGCINKEIETYEELYRLLIEYGLLYNF